MGWIMDKYIQHSPDDVAVGAVISVKAESLGGNAGRTEGAGFGFYWALKEFMKYQETIQSHEISNIINL